MSKQWEPACVEFVPKTNGNREKEPAEQVRVFYRPFGVGENIDYLREWQRRNRANLYIAEKIQALEIAPEGEEPKDAAKREKAAAKHVPGLLDDLKATESEVLDLAFKRIEKATRGPSTIEGIEDYRANIYTVRAMAMEIANEITASGGVREEDRPT